MSIYSGRILDNSHNLSTPTSIRSTYNNINYIQFNTNIKKINFQNSPLNIKMKAPSNLIPKPFNSIYHSMTRKYNKYTISEPNLNNDITYKNIKESSKRLQNRLDKLINHSKEVKLENERNRSIRNEYFNKNNSSQRTSSIDLSGKFDKILNGKNSIISTFKKLNNIINGDFSQNNSKRKKSKSKNKIKKSVSSIKKNSNSYILKNNNLKKNDNYDLNELNDLSHLADDFLNAFDLNINGIKIKNNLKENKEEENKNEIENNNLNEENENKKNEDNSKLINEKKDKSSDNKIENSLLSNDKLNTPLRDYNFNLEDYGIYKENVYFRNETDFLKANYDTDSNYFFDNLNKNYNDLSDNNFKNDKELELQNKFDENIKKNIFDNDILNSDDKEIDVNLIKKNEISVISENKDSNEKQIKNPFKETINIFTFEQNNEIDDKEKNNKEINENDEFKNKNLFEENNLIESDILEDKKFEQVQKFKKKNKVKNPFINEDEIKNENEENNLLYSSDDEYNIDIIEQNNKEKSTKIDTNELNSNIKNLNLSEIEN